LVIFVIRTRRTPFYRSRPSRLLAFSTLIIVASALVIPFTPIGGLFRFVQLPLTFFVILAALIGVYLAVVELVKKWFFKRWAYRM
jgi:Mg2+-importing ATPase